jgi:hypothetical protein
MEWYQNIKGRLKNRTSVYFILFILFYLIQGLLAIVHHKAPPHDMFAAAAIMFLFLIVHMSVGFKESVPIFMGIGFIPHLIGLYEVFFFLNEITGTLYGSPYFNYHYDWFVHAFAMFCYAIAFCSMVFERLRVSFKSSFVAFVVVLMILTGIGCVNEVVEFVGYELFEYGKGFLEYGEGDASPDSGPWQNASMDSVNNILGGALGILIYMQFRRKKHLI